MALKALILLFFLAILLLEFDNGKKLSRLGNYTSEEDIIEYSKYILYKGDTLNKYDPGNKPIGLWIFYSKAWKVAIGGGEKKVDSVNVSYRLDSVGHFKDGKQIGQWITLNRYGDTVNVKYYK